MIKSKDLLEKLVETAIVSSRVSGGREKVLILNYIRNQLQTYNREEYLPVSSRLCLAELMTWQDRLDEALELCNSIIDEYTFHQDAYLQKSKILIQMGSIGKAEEILSIIQKANPHSAIFQRYVAMCKFQSGRLTEGWEDARAAFNFGNLKIRYNNMKRWTGEDLHNKTIVISMLDIRGGGDEIFFCSALPKIIEKAKLCFIETEPRAFSLYKSSFSKSVVFNRGTEPWVEMGLSIDYHLWARELPAYFFRKESDFPNSPGYLKLAFSEQKHWSEKVNKVSDNKKKIGICWTSLNVTGPAQPFVSNLLDWEPILTLPDSVFINMHCLDGKEEVIAAEKKFNLKLIQFREADFKNSFEHIAGMASACDLIISVATTNGSVIPGALGLNVIEIRPSFNSISMDGLPWYPNHQRVYKPWNISYVSKLRDIADQIREWTPDKPVPKIRSTNL